MFNIPFIYRGGFDGGDPLPLYGTAEAIIWLDADQYVYKDYGVTSASFGNDVFQWNDLTSYRNNVTGSTTETPLYSGITFAPSGSTSVFPYIEFNETNQDYLAVKSSASLQSISSGYTLFFVMRKNATGTWSPGDNPIIEWNDSWTTPFDGMGVDGDSSPVTLQCWYYANNSQLNQISIPWGDNGVDEEKFFYYTVRLSGNSATNRTSLNGYVGRVLKASTIFTGSGMKKPPTTTSRFSVGSGFSSGSVVQTSEIDITEVILYNGALSDTQLSGVWNYLRQKYGFI